MLDWCNLEIALKRRHNLEERMRLGIGRDRQAMGRTSAEVLAMQAKCYGGLLRDMESTLNARHTGTGRTAGRVCLRVVDRSTM